VTDWPVWVFCNLLYLDFHAQPFLGFTKNGLKREFARAHQNWTVEDWKNVAWSDESRFLLRHSDGWVRIWRKQNENMDPSCLVTTVQAGGGGVMCGGYLNATAHLSIVSDHVHPLWPPCTHPLMATSSRIVHYVTKLESFQIGFLNMTMSSLY